MKDTGVEACEIVAYRDEHGPAFAKLNRDWLHAAGIYEEADGIHLDTPRESILDCGGQILIAQKDGNVIGTCALVACPDGSLELAKLAVAPAARGKGLGRVLAESAIELAGTRGVKRIVLSSQSSLTTALALYESLGFQYAPVPRDQTYQTVDVYMVLELTGCSATQLKR
ncbi:MAG: GNAT family N-acetyltransferase [Rhodanobacter sp.]